MLASFLSRVAVKDSLAIKARSAVAKPSKNGERFSRPAIEVEQAFNLSMNLIVKEKCHGPARKPRCVGGCAVCDRGIRECGRGEGDGSCKARGRLCGERDRGRHPRLR